MPNISAHSEAKPFLQLEEDTGSRNSDIWNSEEDLLPSRGGSRPSILERLPLWLHLTLLLVNIILLVWNSRAATKTLGFTYNANIPAGAGETLCTSSILQSGHQC